MHLNVDLSSLKIEAAKMHGLEGLITCLHKLEMSYESGLQKAIEFTSANGGTVEKLEDGVTRLALNGFKVDCFCHYHNNRFYFEYLRSGE